jgi:NDP-sugar pyrophosphorylase family protein
MNMHFSIPKKIKKNSIFLGVICGGRGSRLKTINKAKPKLFTSISKNKNFFDFFLKKKLISLNENVTFLISDIAQKFQKKILEASKKFYLISEKKKIGTAGSLVKNIHYFKKNFILIFGDILFEEDLRKIFNYHRNNKNDVTIYVHKKSNIFDVNLLKLNNDYSFSNIIFNKKSKHKNLMNLCLGGIYVFNKNFFKNISNFKNKIKLDLESDFLKNSKNLKRFKIGYYLSNNYLNDFGTLDRLKDLKNYLKYKNKKIKIKYHLTYDKTIISKLEQISKKLHSVRKVRFNYIFILTIFIKNGEKNTKLQVEKMIDSFFANRMLYVNNIEFSNLSSQVV